MMLRVSAVLAALLLAPVSAFTAPPSATRRATLRLPSTVVMAATMPNPLSKLPWNVKREAERAARRMKQERNTLHRQLGIAEDATYEEIVTATDGLIAKAAGNLKEKVKIEVAKDQILQIRLNERLAGLTATTKEARAQSRFETAGSDEDDAPVKQEETQQMPTWTRGLIVKPTAEHAKGQLRLWGILTGIGAVFPPAQEYMGRFTWLVCVAQLTFRGMPREQQESGGMGMNFNSGGGGKHRKVAFALGFTTWIVGATVVYGLMPAWAKGQRWTSSLGFAMQNFIFGVVCSYVQPYKG